MERFQDYSQKSDNCRLSLKLIQRVTPFMLEGPSYYAGDSYNHDSFIRIPLFFNLVRFKDKQECVDIETGYQQT